LLPTYRGPVTAFGEVLTGQLTPLIQFDYSNGAPYEIQAPIYRNDITNASYEYANGMLKLTAISPSGNDTAIQAYSSEYTKYSAGMGIDARMTAVFDADNGAGINQYIGLFTPENSLTFGYFDTNGFCIRHGRAGIQQIVDINITAGTSNGTQVQLSFNGTTVTTSGLINTNSIVTGASAITDAINTSINLNTYGWKATYFRANSAATTYTVRAIRNYSNTTNITVTVSISGGYTTSVTALRSGITTSYTYILQADWNIDTCLGLSVGTLQTRYDRNSSGFQLIPTNGNVYRIVFQYLGFGGITFYIENHETGIFMPVHQIKYTNTAIVPSVTSPNYKIGYGINNTTNTTVTLAAGSIAAFVQGHTIPSPIYRSYPGIISANTGGALTITKLNARIIFGFRILETKSSTNSNATLTTTINRTNFLLTSLSAALNIASSNNPNPQPSANTIFQLVKNPLGFFLGDPPTTSYKPLWTIYEDDPSILIFDGTIRTSTSTGIGYTGGINVIDLPLVENTSSTINLQSLLINVSSEDVYIITYFGNTNTTVTTFDVLATISYQINN
jgi:hypothetical protein